ncbi:MAG TPA: hypothetical protein PK562_01725 [Candidatus Omnitrophota bacterium]|nr:hypothetical protein [Candidatus Omnitrophota bacterium]
MRMLIACIAVCSLVAGVVLIKAPARAIELQKRFYLLINWRIEPVDYAREIRNTRAMGIFLIAAVIASLFYGAWQRLLP